MRKVDFGGLMNGILHSKFWVVDRKHVFIGSANMDWRAITQVKLATAQVSASLETFLKRFLSPPARSLENNLWAFSVVWKFNTGFLFCLFSSTFKKKKKNYCRKNV